MTEQGDDDRTGGQSREKKIAGVKKQTEYDKGLKTGKDEDSRWVSNHPHPDTISSSFLILAHTFVNVNSSKIPDLPSPVIPQFRPSLRFSTSLISRLYPLLCTPQTRIFTFNHVSSLSPNVLTGITQN